MPPPVSQRNRGDAPDSLGGLDPLLIQLKCHQGFWQLSQVGLEGSCSTQGTQGSALRVAPDGGHQVVLLLGILIPIPPNLNIPKYPLVSLAWWSLWHCLTPSNHLATFS